MSPVTALPLLYTTFLLRCTRVKWSRWMTTKFQLGLCFSYVAVMLQFALTHSPVWELLFGRTLSKSCWRMKSSLGPSWFFCTPHRPAKTKCSPHCTPTSGTPEKLSVRLAEKKKKSTKMNLLCVCVKSKTLTFAAEEFVHRFTPSLDIIQRILGKATQSTLEQRITINHWPSFCVNSAATDPDPTTHSSG